MKRNKKNNAPKTNENDSKRKGETANQSKNRRTKKRRAEFEGPSEISHKRILDMRMAETAVAKATEDRRLRDAEEKETRMLNGHAWLSLSLVPQGQVEPPAASNPTNVGGGRGCALPTVWPGRGVATEPLA